MFLALVFMAFLGMSMNVGAEEVPNSDEPSPLGSIDEYRLDYDGVVTEWIEQEIDTATGTSYMLHEHHGGWWADAEKGPGDDGKGNPAPDNPGDEDDLLCWAATVSNMLEYTGWGFVGGMENGNTDDFFDYFIDHTTDYGSLNPYAIEWWFTGNLPTHSGDWSVEDVEGGDFWSSSYTWTSYSSESAGGASVLPDIKSYLTSGYAVGLAIYPITPPGGHAITCWGVNYDTSKNPATEPNDYYLGIWVSDSDSHKGSSDPDDYLRYFEVEWDSTNSYWYMPNYGSGWKISAVTALHPFPGESRPVANAGTPSGTEGTAVTFNAGSTSDPDSDPLKYRWDFDGDGDWDTGWSTSATATNNWNDDYSGDVYLEVFDGRLRDVDVTTVTVSNVAPSITATGATINEDGIATVSGTITDPSPEDTFELEIDWGEGSPQTYSYGAGTTLFSETHQYLDDDPTATLSDIYTISLSITDDDAGTDSTSTSVTVNNVNPVTSIDNLAQPNPQFILPIVHTLDFYGSFTDVGTQDTHTAIWDWGDSTTNSGTVVESGGSGTVTGSHVFMLPGIYIVTLTVTDDDSGIDSDTFAIEVVDAQGALDDLNDYINNLDDSAFKNNGAQCKNAFSNMIDALHSMVDSAAYNGAIHDMQNNLRGKADGTQGGNPKNDWITDPTAQYDITMKLDDISAYLATFL